MAGSRRWFGYTADNGDIFNIELNENTGETAALDFTQVNRTRPAILISSTRPLRPRYILVQRQGHAARRRYIVGTTSAIAQLAQDGEVTIDGINWLITGAVGERRIIIPTRDTAQDDGDVDVN